MKQNFVFFVVACLFSLSSDIMPQSEVVEYYEKLKQIKIFKSTRTDVESLFSFRSFKDSKESDGSKTVYYEMEGANLNVYYSTGRCSEHQSKLGFDVGRDIVIGWSLDFYTDVAISQFDFDIRKFRKYKEKDNNAIHYRNEKLGIELIGGKDRITSIEFTGMKTQKNIYHCK